MTRERIESGAISNIRQGKPRFYLSRIEFVSSYQGYTSHHLDSVPREIGGNAKLQFRGNMPAASRDRFSAQEQLFRDRLAAIAHGDRCENRALARQLEPAWLTTRT